MNIYVGNLSQETTVADLQDIFGPFGRVASASIIRDKMIGISMGFGFVEMPNEAEAHAAITGLNGKELKGRPLTVSEARPRREDRRGGRDDRCGGRRSW